MVRFKSFFYFLDNKIVFTASVAVKEGEREWKNRLQSDKDLKVFLICEMLSNMP